MAITFEITGAPVAKGRPRFRALKKFISTYTPKKTLVAEDHILQSFKEQNPTFKTPLEGPISIVVKFFMPIPSSLSKKKQEQLKLSPHIKKPDLDNLLKTVCDALNGYVWKDDSQIYLITAVKAYYGQPLKEYPYTLVEIHNH